MNKKHFAIILTVSIAVMFFVLYFMMLNDTNSIIEDFRKCQICDNEASELSMAALYNRYYRKDHEKRIAQVNIKIRRDFVLHDFKKGVMYVTFTCEKFDQNGAAIYGAADIKAKWNIEKHNNRWIVTNIQEAP